ncbi:hypothetical protein EOD23_32065, partial [Mesorhizobium sp. USDA-HM6]
RFTETANRSISLLRQFRTENRFTLFLELPWWRRPPWLPRSSRSSRRTRCWERNGACKRFLAVDE